jgi:hypothetical protein
MRALRIGPALPLFRLNAAEESAMRLTPLLAAGLLAAGLGAAGAEPARWQAEWPDTDFSQTSVENWSEILSGGPPKDGIPALSDPGFIPVAEETRIGAREPVVALEIDGATPRAYPIRYLTWHEIVNDTVAGRAGGGDLLPALQLLPGLRPAGGRRTAGPSACRASCATPTW